MSWPSVLKHYYTHISILEVFSRAERTRNRLPTPSSSPGAKTLLTYRKTESAGLQSNFLRRKLTTVSNFCDAETLNTFCRRMGAEPTALN
jgi:hypothetical protein